MWNKRLIESHNEAARLVCEVKNEALDYIEKRQSCSEFDVSTFILSRFKVKGLKTNGQPMVAFRENTTLVHYEPKKSPAKRMRHNSLIMIDLWARSKQQNSPFADVTWMAFYGNSVPKDILRVFAIVKKARNRALSFLKANLKDKELPLGMKVHNEVKKSIDSSDYGDYMSNYTGHSIGLTSPHGNRGNLNKWSKGKLVINQGYTLEPEIDYKDKFGIRLELNFYINNNYELIITTDKQEEITIIGEGRLKK